MIYEVRIYTANPGRLPSLLHLFDHHVLKIWGRLLIAQVGFWTVMVGDGSNDLHCCISWKSLAEREDRWAAFEADPEWQRVCGEAEEDGPILANIDVVFLKPTSFSALK
jgi:NIPSNAP